MTYNLALQPAHNLLTLTTTCSQFCEQIGLFITNTNFQHRRKHTWVSPDGKTKNTIDFIICKKSYLLNIRDTHVVSNPDISDHRLLRCKVLINATVCYKSKSTPRYDVGKLRNPQTHLEFQENVSEILIKANVLQKEDVGDLYSTVKTSLIDSSAKVLGKLKPTKTEEWISPSTLQSIKLKHEIRKTLGPDSILYKCHSANVKKLCRIDKEAAEERQHKDLDKYQLNQKYFETMKRLKLNRTKKTKSWKIKGKDGNHIIDK